MALEFKRKASKLSSSLFKNFTVDPVDKQKLTLIRAFPIPNTVDDIREFVLLAIANIDVNLSRNTLFSKWGKRGGQETGQTIELIISDAWISKMQQAYKQAKLGFHDDPEFKVIEDLYFDKMKELRIEIDEAD